MGLVVTPSCLGMRMTAKSSYPKIVHLIWLSEADQRRRGRRLTPVLQPVVKLLLVSMTYSNRAVIRTY